MTPTREDILAAHERIQPFVHRTPVFTSQGLDKQTGTEIYFKCENFQKTGSFKVRGATNAILQLTGEERSRGVATHSSGNHAQALARAAGQAGVDVTIVMPRNSNPKKREATLSYGATIVDCAPTFSDREGTLQKVLDDSGARFVPPFDHEHIIAGQATAAKELLEEIPDLEILVAPVGGGGLLSGTALAAAYLAPRVGVVGAEPELADDAFRSLELGTIQPMEQTDTIADGLRTSLGEKTFRIIRDHVAAIVTVSEEEIMNAMRLTWERMKLVVEPSAAVAVAALLRDSARFEGKRVGVILSGGNVDLDNLPF
jgi:threonine dehydratase